MTCLSFEVVGDGIEGSSDRVQGSMLDFDGEVDMIDPGLLITGG